MRVSNLAPGMIFSLVDKMPANVPSLSDKLPTHFYMIISAGSDACLQDIQCMKITSMKNKESTYELPVVLNDAVSYVVPYNIFSYRRDDINMRFFAGILIGDPDVCSTDEFLSLCRDIYTDTLFGEMDSTLRTRIKDYQTKFNSKFSKVPKYSDAQSAKFTFTTDDTPMQTAITAHEIYPMVSDSDEQFKSSIKWIDSLPNRYAAWSNEDVMRALLFFGNNAPISIASKSNRFTSVGTIDNLARQFRKRISDATPSPIYTRIINGREYKFNFKTGSVVGGIVSADSRECAAISVQIKKAMRINK